MATRSRALIKHENTDEHLVENKMKTGSEIERRRALGDLHNKPGVIQQEKKASLDKEKKNGLITAVYKDVKPRVDSRWKRSKESIPIVVKESIIKKDTIKAIEIKPQQKIVHREAIKSIGINAATFADGPRKPCSLILKKEKLSPVKKNQSNADFISHSAKLITQIDANDIDANDHANPQLLSEYVNDIYAYLFKLENIFSIRQNFLDAQIDVTPKMRSVLLDWINEVHHQFRLENETYHMAVSMIDRYLMACSHTTRKQLQLVGVTALFMASKYEELMPPDITDFVFVTDDTYTKKQILEMEKKLFRTLKFDLSKPLPIHFLRRFAKAAGNIGDCKYIMAKYLIELASNEYTLAHYKPSEIAASSLYLSLYLLNQNDEMTEDFHSIKLWTPSLQYYSTYTSQQLLKIVKQLANLVKHAKDSKLKAVFTKYSRDNCQKVSNMPELSSGLKIDAIINMS